MRAIKEVIVVEGRDDTRRLREVFGEVDTIETNGSEINQETLALIAKAQALRGVIVLTDPDFSGEKIRTTIQQAVPGVKHAFITKKNAVGKRKGSSLGVEHASPETLRQALKMAHQSLEEPDMMSSQISRGLLMDLGLIGGAGSANLRQEVTEYLAVGYTNGKQLLNRLHLFAISEEELRAAVDHVKKTSPRRGER